MLSKFESIKLIGTLAPVNPHALFTSLGNCTHMANILILYLLKTQQISVLECSTVQTIIANH